MAWLCQRRGAAAMESFASTTSSVAGGQVTFDVVIRFLQEQALSAAHERTQAATRVLGLEVRLLARAPPRRASSSSLHARFLPR